MDLKPVRDELDKIDNAIKHLLVLRMSLIPIVTKIKLENNLNFFQPKREEEIYSKIKAFSDNTGISNELLKEIYGLIIKSSLEIENNNIPDTIDVNDEVLEKYKEIDKILDNIPQIISEISESMPDNNLSEISTGIYERRLYEL